MPNLRRRLLPLLLLAAACGSEPPAALPAGQWVAPEAHLTVADSGTFLELVCRDARLPAVLPLDAHGRFSVDTTIAEYGIALHVYRARVAGQLEDGTLRLTVTPLEPAAGAQSFQLHPGSAPRFPPCG